mmetsp:Transcript_8288/g.16863  ORF Transcript_8288/g.16863 Transcript_8288/m.16863 type:complete len:94 (+) Transcript_8288:1053-1334(+)
MYECRGDRDAEMEETKTILYRAAWHTSAEMEEMTRDDSFDSRSRVSREADGADNVRAEGCPRPIPRSETPGKIRAVHHRNADTLGITLLTAML